MPEIKRTVFINGPVDKVFAFAKDPQKWNVWCPNLTTPQTVTGTGGKGTVVQNGIKFAGINFPITTTVTIANPGPNGAQLAGEFKGPFTGTFDLTFTPHPAGTQLTYRYTYNVPPAALNNIADPFVIEKMEENGVETALGNLKLLCECEVPVGVH